MVNDRVLCIAAREHDFDARTAAAGFLREEAPIHLWQYHVGEKQADVFVLFD